MRGAKILNAIAVLVALCCAAPVTAQTAKVISPLKAVDDLNGVNILTGKAQVPVPTISIPAAPRLNFDLIQNAMPKLVARISEGTPVSSSVAIHNGSGTSDSFTCTNDDICNTRKANGARLEGSIAIGGPYTYIEGRTGVRYEFDSLEYDSGTFAPRQVQYYATSITYPDGEYITLTYEKTAYPGWASRYSHRLTQMSSSLGYYLTFSYAGSDVTTAPWYALAQAKMYKSGNASPLAQLTYSGSTVTDIAGRTYNCTPCRNEVGGPVESSAEALTYPTEGTPAKVLTDNSAYSGLVASVTRDGVAWNYSYSSPLSLGLGNWAYSGVTVTGPNSYSQTYAIAAGNSDLPNLMTSSTDALGRTTSYLNDGNFRLYRVTAPEGNYTQVTYGVYGNITSKVSYPKPGSGLGALTESSTFNAPNCTTPVLCFRPTSYTDTLGRTTDYTYDLAGRLTLELAPADASGLRRATYLDYTTSYTAPTTVRVCAYGSTCGTSAELKTIYTYFGATALPITETKYDGLAGTSLTTAYTYDDAGRVTSVDGPLAGTGDAKYFRYDVIGRKTWEIGPANADNSRPATKYTYRDADDKVVATDTGVIVDQNSSTFYGTPAVVHVDTSYDSHRNPSKVATSSGVTTYQVATSSYDNRGQMTCSTVRMNETAFASLPSDACTLGTQGSFGPDRITKNTYDAAGQLLKVQKAYGTSLQQDYVTYTYTNNGKQASVKDANGNLASLTYDGFDRQARWYLPSKTTSGVASTTDYEEYGYDAAGNRTSMRKRDGRVFTFTYDNLNRVLSKIVPDGCAPIQVGGCPSASATRDVYYKYDIRGLQTSANFDSPTGEGVSVTFDGFGRKTSEMINISGFSKSLTSSFDAHGNRTLITHSDGYHFGMGFDAGDRPTGLTDHYGTTLASFSSDPLGRPTLLYRNNAAYTSWAYDPVGRLAAHTQDLSGTAYDISWTHAWSPANQLVGWTKSNGVYAYPDVAKSLSYTVNGLNQYATVNSNTYTYDANGNLVSDGGLTMVYDAENRLISASGTKSAGLAYDPLGRLYETNNGSGGGITRFLYDGDELIAEYNSTGTVLNRYVHGPSADDPLMWYQGSALSSPLYLHADRQGSIVATTMSNGVPAYIHGYDEWGVPSNPVGRFGYTGQAWLPELGMYYYKARMYSPTLGRFLQTDPVGYDDQINLYAYVGNDPINGTDPTGMVESLVSGIDKGNALYMGIPASTSVSKESDSRAVARSTQSNANRPGSGRVDVRKLRREWEELHSKPWPKEEGSTKNQHAHHKVPLADGGPDDVSNIEPKPADAHRAWHRENGDFKRWGARGSPSLGIIGGASNLLGIFSGRIRTDTWEHLGYDMMGLESPSDSRKRNMAECGRELCGPVI